MKKIKFMVNGKSILYDIKKDRFNFLGQEINSTDLEILIFQVNFEKAKEDLDIERLLNSLVQNIFEMRGVEATILLLADLGVTKEQLIHYFGFSKEEIEKYERNYGYL